MKLPIRHSLAARCVILILSLLCSLSSTASDFEDIGDQLIGSADLNGDGRPDLVVIDKSSGAMSIGLQDNSGAISWTAAYSTGLNAVTAVAAGNFLQTSRQSLALVSESENHALFLDWSDLQSPPAITEIHSTAVGPHGAAPLVPGSDNTTDDLVLTGANLDPPSVDGFDWQGTSGGLPQSMFQFRIDRRLEAPQALPGGSASEHFIAGIIRGQNDTFQAYRLTPNAADSLASLPGLPAGSDFLSGQTQAGACCCFSRLDNRTSFCNRSPSGLTPHLEHSSKPMSGRPWRELMPSTRAWMARHS